VSDRHLVLQAPCGCVRMAGVPPVTKDYRRRLYRQARDRGWHVAEMTPSELEAAWQCKTVDCPFRRQEVAS